MIQNKHILLVIGGGIAAVKSQMLIRSLRNEGAEVEVVLTKAGKQFVTPLSLAALSGNSVYEKLWSKKEAAEMSHINLSRRADCILVAPATANFLAKMAHGIADDLASTLLLASNAPILVAPAMNPQMLAHSAVQDNIRLLAERGIRFIGPESGEAACGETGEGRMSEPEQIIEALNIFLAQPLKGKTAMITAGATREAIDPVRFLSNRSSGKQGYAIADALAKLGAKVHLISGASDIAPPKGIETEQVETAEQMLTACEQTLPCHIGIFTAAISDWRIAKKAAQKIKKSAGTPHLILEENPDILAHIGTHKKRPELLIGFAAETEKLLEQAKAKRKSKSCDWIIANNISQDIMGSDENEIHLIKPASAQHWKRMSKKAIGERLGNEIVSYFEQQE